MAMRMSVISMIASQVSQDPSDKALENLLIMRMPMAMVGMSESSKAYNVDHETENADYQEFIEPM